MAAIAPSQNAQLRMPCRHCLQEINAGASICMHCRQHQSRWTSALTVASTAAAAVSVVGAAITYVVSTLPELRKMARWDDSVEVLQFTTRKGLSIANSGDGPIYVSHLKLKAAYPDGRHLFTRTVQIDQEIERRKSHASKGDDQLLSKGTQLDIPMHDSSEAFTVSLDRSGDMAAMLNGARCHLWVVYSEGSPLLALYKERMGEYLYSFPVEARLTYYSFGSKKTRELQIPVVGILHRSRHEKCTSGAPQAVDAVAAPMVSRP
ncbi:MAG: hypothetical protein IBJ14_05260 [Hydrogenophaga sp.]|nr:hypothetical protein [Hydrogenophaga sp.]